MLRIRFLLTLYPFLPSLLRLYPCIGYDWCSRYHKAVTNNRQMEGAEVKEFINTPFEIMFEFFHQPPTLRISGRTVTNTRLDTYAYGKMLVMPATVWWAHDRPRSDLNPSKRSRPAGQILVEHSDMYKTVRLTTCREQVVNVSLVSYIDQAFAQKELDKFSLYLLKNLRQLVQKGTPINAAISTMFDYYPALSKHLESISVDLCLPKLCTSAYELALEIEKKFQD